MRLDDGGGGGVQAAVEEKGAVALCRCFASNKFPLCDGSHNKHNELCGDNAGPIVLKSLGGGGKSVDVPKVDDSGLQVLHSDCFYCIHVGYLVMAIRSVFLHCFCACATSWLLFSGHLGSRFVAVSSLRMILCSFLPALVPGCSSEDAHE